MAPESIVLIVFSVLLVDPIPPTLEFLIFVSTPFHRRVLGIPRFLLVRNGSKTDQIGSQEVHVGRVSVPVTSRRESVFHLGGIRFPKL